MLLLVLQKGHQVSEHGALRGDLPPKADSSISPEATCHVPQKLSVLPFLLAKDMCLQKRPSLKANSGVSSALKTSRTPSVPKYFTFYKIPFSYF